MTHFAAVFSQSAAHLQGRGLCRRPSVFPEILEPVGRQGGISRCRNNPAMAKIALYRPCVPAVIGQLIAAAVSKHVTVDQKRERGQAGEIVSWVHSLLQGQPL